MIKTIEIENALGRINGDIFQEFCNHFLYLKLNPNRIEPIGSVVGKEKSRKGIPDCYFYHNDELIFAEYTTHEKISGSLTFFKKLKQDIRNCFEETKTKIKSADISSVILCFTSRLTPIEQEELKKECKKFNPYCKLELYGIRSLSFAVLDYPILGISYLGIRIGTQQILSVSDFVSNYERSKLATPLSNAFIGREKEIADGLNQLTINDILLIHGEPGTGKSKLALELCSKFIQNNERFEFLCVANKGLAIWDDLQSFFKKDKNYIILVDDANRIAKNYQWILMLTREFPQHKFKVVVTVRDYALGQIRLLSNEYYYSTLEIKKFTNEEIIELLKSKDVSVIDPMVVDGIKRLARGNPRLAIMGAKIAREKKDLQLLYDASQIYEEYYNPIIHEIPMLSDTNTLIVLAIISFFGKIDKDNRTLCEKIFTNINIDEDSFWNICYQLNEKELVDLFESQIVKVSDQIFSTFVFYKSVIDLEKLEFRFFLDLFLDYEYRIKDTLIPVLNTFNYKKIENKLKPQVLRKWNEIEKVNNHENSLKYLHLFWFYLSPQTLIYAKKYINSIQVDKSKDYRYTIKHNEFSGGPGRLIDILAGFRYLNAEDFKDAVTLLFYYGINIPAKMPSIMYVLNEYFSFKRLSYAYGNYIQHIIIDYLIDNARTSKNQDVFENILLEILPKYLKIEFHDSESEGRNFMLYTFHIWLSDSIKEFRQKCFEFLAYKSKSNTNFVREIIFKIDVYDYKHSKEICDFDMNYLIPIIKESFNPDSFEDCFVLHDFADKFEYLEYEFPIELRQKYSNRLFKLAEVLKRDRTFRKKGLSWEEEQEIHEKELIRYCEGFVFEDYQNLFQNVQIIVLKTKKDNIEYQYYRAVDIILGHVAKTNLSLFLKIFKDLIKNYSFRVNYLYLFNSYFSINPDYHVELFKIIKKLDEGVKLDFHHALNITHVSDVELELYYNDLIEAFVNISRSHEYWNLNFIGKYQLYKSELEIYTDVTNAILNNIKIGEYKLSVGPDFLERCLDIKGFPSQSIYSLYLASEKNEDGFDYNKTVLKKLLSKRSQFIIELLKHTYQNRISHHDLKHDKFDIIWELENCEEILDLLFVYFSDALFYSPWANPINAFFSDGKANKEKAISFLARMLGKHYNNLNFTKLLFNVVCYSFRSEHSKFLRQFLELNSSFELFERLCLIPNHGVYSGSRIPIIENEKKSWKGILDVINGMPNKIDFLEHKEYINRQIDYCDIEKQREIKREFMEDYL
ncbi:ATP-binding protein [Maribellus sediminis]|uniref:nSTAND3 domain-containing NTPase n=1 Tax=Maribellus sediminis TaxID=2696285 RepID=UPI001430B9D2|nr:ATP-binding protein [Maribellus sediminis]